jgi:hypothetical protein
MESFANRGRVLNCSLKRGLQPASTPIGKATLMRPKGRAPQIKTLPKALAFIPTITQLFGKK